MTLLCMKASIVLKKSQTEASSINSYLNKKTLLDLIFFEENQLFSNLAIKKVQNHFKPSSSLISTRKIYQHIEQVNSKFSITNQPAHPCRRTCMISIENEIRRLF